MYSRHIDGADRNFGVSGKLWNGVLVLYDDETDSLWTQIDGRAIHGDATGTRLEHVDSVFTTWSQWLSLHPDTEVLARDPDAEPVTASHYEEYLSDSSRLFMPELGEGLGGIAAKDLVFGVVLGAEAWAVSEAVLVAEEVVQTVLGGSLVTVLYERESQRARAIVSASDDDALLLEAIPGVSPFERLRDVRTGEELDPETRPSLRLDRAYWYAWSRSHLGSRILAD